MSKEENNPIRPGQDTEAPQSGERLPLGKILDLLEEESYSGSRYVSIDVPGIGTHDDFNPAERMKGNSDSLCFVHVLEDSLQELGIRVGDLLCIDKAASPRPGDLVVSEAGGMVVYRFHRENGIHELRPVNPLLETIRSADPASFGIWGVVKMVARAFERDGRSDFPLGSEPEIAKPES